MLEERFNALPGMQSLPNENKLHARVRVWLNWMRMMPLPERKCFQHSDWLWLGQA